MAQWCEAIREGRRQLCRRLGTDSPQKPDLRSLAYSPDATGGTLWRFPDTFNLSDPDGFYQSVILPREERQVRGLLYGQLRKPAASKKTGAEVRTEEDTGGGDSGGEKDLLVGLTSTTTGSFLRERTIARR